MIKIALSEQLAKHNLSQIEFAKITGINKNTISSYCNNTCKHIVIEHLDKICKTLTCEITDILDFNNDNIQYAQLKDMLLHMAQHMTEDMTNSSNDPIQKQILHSVFTSPEFLSLFTNKALENIILHSNHNDK